MSLRLALFDRNGTPVDRDGTPVDPGGAPVDRDGAIVAAMTRAIAALGLDLPPAHEIRAIIGLSLPVALATLS